MNRPCILGTAGHIDHGKTRLIKMLTGVDTDRLKDEKRRGISIELGFASLVTPSGIQCGVVDVPGHERFIRNMLAGAGGIDVILLVIAADEGVMPQTREHLDIVEILGARTGVVALTKVDIVDEEWLELVRADVSQYLAGTCLAGAPIVPVSAATEAGKEDLLAAIDAAVASADLAPRGRFPRLPIDRVFTMAGFGTVVTGTLWAGRIREGDRVRIEPGGIATRIKSLEVHNRRVSEALPGQRAAVSIHGVPREEIERGAWLVTPDPPPLARLLQARVRCVPNSPFPIRHRMRVRFYLGASEILGRISPLETEEMKPGSEGFVQLHLEKPCLAERGDRFVLRSYSPMRTIGGGTVVDVSGTRRRRFRPSDLQALRLAEEGSIEERLLGTIASGGSLGVAEGDLAGRLGQPQAEVAAALESLMQAGEIHRIGRKTLIARDAMLGAHGGIVSFLETHHRQNPLSWGPTKSEIKSRLEKRVHPDLIEAWIRDRAADSTLHIREDRLRIGAARIDLTPAHATIRDRILADLDARGYAAPTAKEMMESIGSPPDGDAILSLLIREGDVVRIPPDLLYRETQLAALRRALLSYFDAHEQMQVAALKETLGVTRKQAVPLLEWLDRQRWTERMGDVRVAGARLREGSPPAD